MNILRWEGRLYIRAVPAKSLFRSNLIHEVITRGDVFAVSVEDNKLTIIPGTAQVEQFDCDANFVARVPKVRPSLQTYRERLAAQKILAEKLAEPSIVERLTPNGQSPLFDFISGERG